MNKKIRFEITSDGKIFAKTIGMDDERCLDYIEVMERILNAETIDSEYTDEFLYAQEKVDQTEQITEEEQIRLKGD